MIVEAKDLTVGYGSKEVLSGINFGIAEGDFVAIVGENGAGKSTLMKTVIGLQKPMRGKLEIREDVVRNGIGYLPQQTDIQKDFPATVYEIVSTGLIKKRTLFKPFISKGDKEKIRKALNTVQMTEKAKVRYSELSGGQQQRVLIARAMCATKSLLIMDEPNAGLDSEATEALYKTLAKLNNEGITIIVVTHDMSNLEKFCTHVVKIRSNVCEYLSIAEWKARHL